MELKNEQLIELFKSRQRRRYSRGIKHKYTKFIMKLRKVKKNLAHGEKPVPIKTHLRNCIILPEMVGSIVGIHNGKEYVNVEIKFDMIGRYLAEFAITYKITKHGKPGIGATKGLIFYNFLLNLFFNNIFLLKKLGSSHVDKTWVKHSTQFLVILLLYWNNLILMILVY